MFEIEKIWIHPKWEETLKKADLINIEAVSNREFDWFEAPNRRRGGWSGVSRIILNPQAQPKDQKAGFLKIQQNHFYRAPATFFRKRLSFIREFEALQELGKVTECVPNLIQYAQWKQGSKLGALLITESLENWQPFDDWLVKQITIDNNDLIHKALKSIAAATRELHQAGWAHFGFYPKHAFIKENQDGTFSTCLIDLEKARRPLFKSQSTIEDVSRFLRHSKKLSNEHKIQYLHDYFESETFSRTQRKLISRMRGVPAV
jgi:hypothetical protein